MAALKYLDKDSYLLNNESMNPIAAGLSMFVSLVSALTVIGLPVEVYQFGDGMLWRLAGGNQWLLILFIEKEPILVLNFTAIDRTFLMQIH